MKIIVGLGNPGVRYQWTRHNVGFQVIDRFAETHQIFVSRKRFKALYGSGRIGSRNVVLAKPLTFMNLSGEAVKKMTAFFGIGLQDLIVVHDDLDLPLGRLRFKQRGGDGGHQGIRSLIGSMGGNSFLRLKVGIGRPPRGMDPAAYVLDSLNPSEEAPFNEVISLAAECLAVLLREGLEMAMNRYQKKLTLPSQSP